MSVMKEGSVPVALFTIDKIEVVVLHVPRQDLICGVARRDAALTLPKAIENVSAGIFFTVVVKV